MAISDYKLKYGNPRDHIHEKIYHKCGLCHQVSIFLISFYLQVDFQEILLDSDEIAHHLKKFHEITHKNYNSKYGEVKQP